MYYFACTALVVVFMYAAGTKLESLPDGDVLLVDAQHNVYGPLLTRLGGNAGSFRSLGYDIRGVGMGASA